MNLCATSISIGSEGSMLTFSGPENMVGMCRMSQIDYKMRFSFNVTTVVLLIRDEFNLKEKFQAFIVLNLP